MACTFSIHIRAFLRAIASDEPVYTMAHLSVADIFEAFTNVTYENNIKTKDLISFHSPLVWKLTKFSREKSIELPESFYALIRQLGALSNS